MEPKHIFQDIKICLDLIQPLRVKKVLKFGLEHTLNCLCWNFRTIYGGWEPSRNRVVVPARQAT
jgi:hypothetical protein